MTDVVFKNISYSIGDKTIINNITGTFKAGRLTAIMGSSGAGKTTLLHLLSGNNNVQGLTLNDTPVTDMSAFSTIVHQFDAILPTMTVYEAIDMSATLRTRLARADRKERINYIINLLGLDKCRNTLIGDETFKGVSGGER